MKTTLSVTQQKSTIFSDVKLLFKGPVLIFNVFPVITGFWLALYFNEVSLVENIDLFLLTTVGSLLVIAGALVFNNWYDVDIDTVMDRTKSRPTVTGNISLKTVLTLSIVLTIIGFIMLLFTTMEATIYAFIGWFTYVVPYTIWSKRRYTFNTIIGSVSGAVTPMIGWAAIESSFQLVPIVLFILLFIWQMPHTYVIAIRKFEEYKAAKVAMLPVVRGIDVAKRHTFAYILCLLPIPFLLLNELGVVFVVIATLLTVMWIILSVYGFFMKDERRWADWNFIYSVNYLFVLFLMMIIVTLPIF